MATAGCDSGEAEKGAASTATLAFPLQSPTEQSPPYSIFTKNQKHGIVLLVAFAAIFSPLSSFIYYPARNALADDLHVSLNRIDLTITSYMVVSGVIPTLVGGMADKFGRRPVYLVIFTIYVIANVALAFQKSYPALLVLRMVQSAGSSGWWSQVNTSEPADLERKELSLSATVSLQISPIQPNADLTSEH